MTTTRAHLRAIARTAAALKRAAAASLLGLALLAASCTTSNKPSSSGALPYAEIENERLPLNEGDCLDGEYFDRATESCEPLENGGASSAPATDSPHLDIPGSAAPGVTDETKK